ncbi:acetylornithine/succinyldiaminopimelate/putrescine aminotransferase [Saccharothrix ecbatanensis]|uniref:Acetylornithine/succinyldiaminopimelate/putresci ne aminotransferase n=1 Tax=Saccharothrix ecbatanensis TaxID=1105145 RepID=A0A7W9HPF4_9PSEU|nr:aminotransferase class III-fold pyridoxal phosphate-dependent enzyme [Saccharothrix ecbatanensis]MBB5805643.1 acetylornithine/succinyldiaminopimelate/putrescine aminotransferase [Saccharothrix ecbatanensis]
MDSTIGSPEFADSFMVERLNEYGLAVRFQRAEGNKLYYVADDGTEVGVLDGVSGFGSLMFGHNNPEIVEHAKWVLDQQTPVHAQMGGYSYALNLATELNKIVRRELQTEDKFFAQFGNTGAEAVEIAIKHAELDRGIRIAGLKGGIEANIAQARAAVSEGATISEAAAAIAGGQDMDRLVAEVTRRNAETEARPAQFLALEGGFHGKLIASVQLTYNPGLRGPFRALAAQATFVPRDQPDMIAKVMEQDRAALLDLVVQDGVVDVVERDFPVFTAFLVEPIMGEAGIYPLTAEHAVALREACDTYGVPLIADEVQSGMGRSGTFLAGTQIGLKPDYIVLAKALGGGIAKLGVVLINEHIYHKPFEFIHSSTFAKDGFSTRIALKVLEMLEAEDGKAYKLAAERGAKAKATMEAIKADYPEIVKEIRGQGLMLGFEFHDQAGSASAKIREANETSVLPLRILGHLMRKHDFRIARTASGPWTMRFEPSIFLTDEEIATVDAAFRDVCEILRSEDVSRFV